MLRHPSKKEKWRTFDYCKIDKYDYSGLEYAVSLDGVRHFEETNKVCIYVYEVDEEANDIYECKKRGDTQYFFARIDCGHVPATVVIHNILTTCYIYY